MPQVRLEAQSLVGFHSVQSLVLQGVGLDLVVEPDTAALLAHVEEDAVARFGNLLQRQVDLLTAVAAHAPKDVSGEAFTVDADQDRFVLGPLTDRQCDVLAHIHVALVGDGLEWAVVGGEAGLGHALDESLCPAALGDDLGDAENLESVFLGKLLQLGEPGHGAVFSHDLADDAGGVHAHHLAKVNGGFGVAGPGQHSAGMIPKGE